MKNTLSNKVLKPIFQLSHPNIYGVEKMAFTPDGKIFISGCSYEIRCWDMTSGRLIRNIKFSEDERLLSLSAIDEKTTICTLKHIDKKININSWDIKSGKLISMLTLNNYPFYYDYWACFNNDGKLACIYRNEVKEIIRGEERFKIRIDKIEVIDTKTGEKIRTFNKYATQLINFVPNSNIIALTSINKIRLFDINTGKLLQILQFEEEIENISFDKSGKLVAVGRNNKVDIINIDTKELISSIKGGFEELKDICFSPQGDFIATLDNNNEIQIWELFTGKLSAVFKNCHEPITFNPKRNVLVSTWCNTIQFWDINSKKLLRTIEPSYGIDLIKFDPKGEKLVTFQTRESEDFLTIWNLKENNIIRINDNDIKDVCFSPDSKFIAIAKKNKKIDLRYVENGELIKNFSSILLRRESCFINFGLRNKILIYSSDDIIIFWDIKTGKWIKFSCKLGDNTSIFFRKKPHLEKIIKGKFHITSPVIFTNNEEMFVFGSQEIIYIWDFNRDICIKTFKGHEADVFFVTFIYNEKMLISASSDGIINCWDINTGEILKTIKADIYNSLRLISCSQNGRIFLLNKNNEIDVWDIEKEKTIYTVKGNFNREMCLSCSPDGRFLVTGNIDGTIDFWEVEKGKRKATLASFPDAWVAVTHDGYFAGEGNYEEYIHFVDEQANIYETNQVNRRLNKIDIF